MKKPQEIEPSSKTLIIDACVASIALISLVAATAYVMSQVAEYVLANV